MKRDVTRVVVASLAVIAAIAAVVLALRTQGSVGPGGVPQSGVPESADPMVSPRGAVVPTVANHGGHAREEADVAAVGARTVEPGAGSGEPSADASCLVRVVDGVGRLAVPGARLWIASGEALTAELAEAAQGGDESLASLSSWCAAHRAAIADDSGELQIPRSPGSRLLLVASDAPVPADAGRVGWCIVGVGEPDATAPVVVTIDARRSLSIRVRDAHGRACAGVPLRVGILRDAWVEAIWRGQSDAEGQAIVTDLLQRTRPRAERTELAGVRGIAFVDAPLGARPRFEFAADDPPREAIDFVMPATGALLVEFAPSLRAPVHDASASVEELALEAAERVLLGGGGREFREGIVRFAPVALGLRLRVHVWIGNASLAHAVEVDDPTAPDEERRVVVSPFADTSLVVVRLLDASGQGLPGRRFDLRIRAESGQSSIESSTTVTSDRDARVRIVQNDELGETAARSFVIRDEGEDLEAGLPLPQPWRKGETDLGDLRLLAAPLLVGGVVLDDAGAPIVGAELRISGVDERPYRSDAEGRFAIRVRNTPDEAALDVSSRSHLPAAAIPFRPGTADLIVRLAAAGAIAGALDHDPLVVRAHFSIACVERGTGTRRVVPIWGRQFEIPSLAPGRYDVGLQLAGRAEPLAHIADVAVTSGATTTLSPFELGGRLRTLGFHVVDEGGAPIAEASALIVADTGTAGAPNFDGVLVQGGKGVVVTADPLVDLLVFAPSCRAELVRGLRDGQLITLRGAHVLQVRVPPAALPPSGFALRVTVETAEPVVPRTGRFVFRGDRSTRATSGGWPYPAGASGIVGGDGTVALRLAVSGRLRIVCAVVRSGDEQAGNVLVPGIAPAEFVFPELAAEQQLDLAIDPAAVAAAVGGLGR